MSPEILLQLQRDNPWLTEPGAPPAQAAARAPEPYLQRRLPAAKRWPVVGRAHLLVGARQVGKSTWLWKQLAAREPPLFLDGEALPVRLWTRSAAAVVADLAGLVGPGRPVLLDEAQHLDDAGLLIKGLVDRGLTNPLYVTGSSAFDLRARTRESLAGRAVRAKLHPLSLPELASTLPEGLAPLPRAWRLRELALRQAVVGGYPEAWLAAEPQRVLGHLLDAIILRDASDLYRVERIGAFRRFLALLARQQGSLVNLSEWAAVCEVARDTLARWLDLLEGAHLVQILRPFSGGRRAEITGRPKVFLSDPGVASALLRRHEPFAERDDQGRLLEAWVAAELPKRFSPILPRREVLFWRSKGGAEVDFVLRGPRDLVAIEVKARDLRRPRLSRSSRSFIDAYAPSRFYVLHLGSDHEERVGDTRVLWRGPEVLAGPEL